MKNKKTEILARIGEIRLLVDSLSAEEMQLKQKLQILFNEEKTKQLKQSNQKL